MEKEERSIILLITSAVTTLLTLTLKSAGDSFFSTLLDTFRYLRLGNVLGAIFFVHSCEKSQSLRSRSTSLGKCSNVDGLNSLKLLPANESCRKTGTRGR